MSPSQKEPDAEAQYDDEIQYSRDLLNLEELEAKYPHRPHNHSKTLPFHELFISLFNPLNENKKPAGPAGGRKQGPHGTNKLSVHEQRRATIERFISRWRTEVGNDFYPALRLILPDKDRDRPMYGLKEKAIAKLLVKMLKINSLSDDAQSIMNWKVPGKTPELSGDFPGRCYAVLSKRAMRGEVGNMRIAEVNQLLDKLAAVSKEEDQLPIFNQFYNGMNASELHWLIRIILRMMKFGATEKTMLHLWHPDAEALFNVSSSLRRVCWELYDPYQRLESDKVGITLMECFQPQLAQFQQATFQKTVDKMQCTSEDAEYWIEEKLDGERMQLHMERDENVPGGFRFGFWSRKGKDYTYLYGSSYEDDKSSLTRFIKGAFEPRVKNIILDGEMITWDPETNKMVAFGTLKTAALSEQRNPYDTTGPRPLFRVFDCLYCNDEDLTKYVLRDRRKTLEAVLTDVHQRIEKHKYIKASQVSEIEPELRKVVAEASEGLVLKNPRSTYRLNMRCDDWVKVKPEYMDGFGESLDCVIIGGYYGQGRRGGILASFLCGLRVDKNHIDRGADPEKCFSFFKVGGGFRAEDYARIKHQTDGKWETYDPKKPPRQYIELGGGDRQYERPDEWIRPSDSVVIQVKASEVTGSDQFATSFTLRFPRFQRLRDDKSWKDALSASEFNTLRAEAEAGSKDKEMKVSAKRGIAKRLKKEVIIAGSDSKVKTKYAGPETKVFEGLNFYVMGDMIHPQKKSKAELEKLIKANGGAVFQSANAREHIICIADKRLVKVQSIMKTGDIQVVKPAWLLDAVKQADIDGPDKAKYVLPLEPNHMFFMPEACRPGIEDNVDIYGDSYARDVTTEELRKLMEDVVAIKDGSFSATEFLGQLEDHGRGLGDIPGSIFRRCVVCFVPAEGEDSDLQLELQIARNQVFFAGGAVVEEEDDLRVTHYVLVDENSGDERRLRSKIKHRDKLPRIVSLDWLRDSWREGTVLDEERYVVS